jgi:hypothetical protein
VLDAHGERGRLLREAIGEEHRGLMVVGVLDQA